MVILINLPVVLRLIARSLKSKELHHPFSTVGNYRRGERRRCWTILIELRRQSNRASIHKLSRRVFWIPGIFRRVRNPRSHYYYMPWRMCLLGVALCRCITFSVSELPAIRLLHTLIRDCGTLGVLRMCGIVISKWPSCHKRCHAQR